MKSTVFETLEEAQEAAAAQAGEKTIKRHAKGWELVVHQETAGAAEEVEEAEDAQEDDEPEEG
jgi:prephenate dehydratase